VSAAPALVENVSVLYVDPAGPYPGLVRDWYDETRDGRTYAGPNPVVAHPPCGPWSTLRSLSHETTQDLAPHAVELVRRWGGVLEHPRASLLFQHCGMPRQGELPDAWGGITFEVCQVDWGHVARKRTWIYVVGARSIPSNPPRREPTHWVSGGGTGRGRTPPGIKVCSAQQRRRTPVEFAKFLIGIAATCRAMPQPRAEQKEHEQK
jgi:hypothetical protein